MRLSGPEIRQLDARLRGVQQNVLGLNVPAGGRAGMKKMRGRGGAACDRPSDRTANTMVGTRPPPPTLEIFKALNDLFNVYDCLRHTILQCGTMGPPVSSMMSL